VALLALPAAGAAADVEAGRRRAEPCAACHGPRGDSPHPSVPSIAGQPAHYLHWPLLLFRDGRRVDAQMSPLAANLSDADMADLAAYYAAQRPEPRPVAPPDAATMAAGEALAQRHHCVRCHAPGLVGQQHVPRVAGLPYDYLVKQLRGFKAQTRGEGDGTMTMAAQVLTPADIELLSRYLAALPPTREPPPR
jgi:cytochrome c553